MSPPKAVLFDFDGTLADTAAIHAEAWRQTLSMMGIEVDPDIPRRAAHEDDRDILRSVLLNQSRPLDDFDRVIAEKQRRTRSLLEQSETLAPGAARVIARLTPSHRLAIVTGTWRENVLSTLGPAGLIHAFEFIIAKEDVAHGKPDPEGYLLALKRLAISPRQAVAVEDSNTGCAAANAAGLRVVLVCTLGRPQETSRDPGALLSIGDTDAMIAAIDHPQRPDR
jgi:HAD superfamily hydrolase (TIGR01509 family)